MTYTFLCKQKLFLLCEITSLPSTVNVLLFVCFFPLFLSPFSVPDAQ